MDDFKREELIEKIVQLEAVKKELKARKLTTDLYEFNKQVLQVEDGKSSLKLAPFHRELCHFITDEKSNKKLVLIPRGHLKALKTEGTVVLTNNGFKKYKELKVGDKIIGGSGKETKVIAVHPKSKMELYEVTTNDGRKIVCNKEHRFLVRLSANSSRWKVRSLKWILPRFSKERYDKRDGKTHYEHPVQLKPIPVFFGKKQLPIDPYTLGMWLGDGHSADSRVCSADPEEFEYSHFDWHKVSGKYNYDTHGLRKILRKNNLLKNKHIPEEYLVSSYQQRLELLRGLMDTDGTCHCQGGIAYFSNTNYRLIEDFVSLVRSLGGVAMLCKVKMKVNEIPYDTWTVSVRLPNNFNPFNLKRKANQYTGLKRELTINIAGVRKVEDEVANCITVESEDGMFIANDYFPTHNSTLVTVGYSLMRIAQDPGVRILIANATYDMSTAFLNHIKKHLRDNEVFKDYYGDYSDNPDKWSENMIAIGKKRTFGRREATVTTYGIGGNLVSQHYDLIIMDDVVNRDFVNTAEQIEKTILFYKDALDLLEPNGKMIIIGTRWSDSDLYGWIMDTTNTEQVYKNFDIMIREAFSGDLDTGKDLKLLWPEKFTPQILQNLRTEKGPYEFGCTPEETPILMGNWSYKRICDVKIGDEVIGFTSINGNRRQYVKTKVVDKGEVFGQINEFKMESGRIVRCTPDHLWFTGRGEKGEHRVYAPAGLEGKVIDGLQFGGFDVFNKLPKKKEYMAGWLGGMFDADGCASSTLSFTQSERNYSNIVERIGKYLSELGFSSSSYRNENRPGIVTVSINGGRSEAIRFLSWCQPTKRENIDKWLLKRAKRLSVKDKIKEVISLGKKKAYWLKTETGNYVAWGYLSKNSQYMNNPVPSAAAKFKPDWIKTVLEDELKIREMSYFTMVDPAIGQLKSSDNSAIVTIGVDQWNNWFVVNIIWGKYLPNEIVNLIFANWEHYQPRKIGIEMTAYQKSIQYAIIDEMRRRNVYLPIVELKANRSKDERIEGMVPRYANGSIYHLLQCPFREQLEDELVRFPRGKHDDIIDALAYGMQIASPSGAHNPRFTRGEDKRPNKYLY